MKSTILLLSLLFHTALFAATRTYPVSEVNFGAYNTVYNLNITGFASGSALNIYQSNGTENEDWRINYISSGVYEIENSTTGLFVTAGTSVATIATQANNNSQRWQIVGVTKDYLGEYLYYKIINIGNGKALTYSGTTVVMSDYTGAENQQWRLDLDGLEGFAALCKVSEGIKASAIGGLLGPTVFVSTLDELAAAIYPTTPKTVVLTANLDAKSYGKRPEIGKYTTIIGSFAANELSDIALGNNSYGWNYGGTYSRAPGDNIIMKNLKITAKANEDNIMIVLLSCKNIWLDHITFNSQLVKNRDEVGKFVWINTPYNGPDQNTNPDFVTISYCTFTNRYWCFAYGTQNTVTTENRTTVAHNIWDSNIRRTPQIGNGTLHNYDNFYVHNTPSQENDGYATLIGGDGSTIYSESNRFHGFMKETSGYWDIEFTVGTGHLFVDKGSYTNKSASGDKTVTPYLWSSTTTFSTVNWDPNTNYAYKRINAYNSSKINDVMAFTAAYSGSQPQMSTFRYITDSDVSAYVAENNANPFLKTIVATPLTYVYSTATTSDWATLANWTPSALPTNIDTAIIRTGECKIAQDFANLVRVEKSGTLRATAFCTIKNIELQGGTLMVNSSNQTLGMNAAITVKDSSTIRSGFNPITLFTLAGTISGSAHLTKTDLGVVKLTATASNFTGKWFVTQDTLTVASATGLGTAGVEVSATAVLDVDIASATGALAVKTGGKLNLDANLTVQTATFDGKPIPAGTFSSTDYPAVISGAGKLVVSTCPACPIIVTQTIKLAQGWNLISTNVHPADSTIATLFKGLNVLEIKDMNSYWRKDQPAFLNLLQTITSGNGYLVNMNAEGTLSITGTLVETQNFASLPAGWSLIGCPYQTATPMAGVLGSNFLEVKDFEGFWMPNVTGSSLVNFEPGKGYFKKK